MCRFTNRPGIAEPEVWFRFLHVVVDGRDGAIVATYSQQMAEIPL
jgi:hypothetical protein